MQVWGVTDRGAVRQQNQDAYAARGLEACRADGGLLAGLNCCKGRCTFPGVAEALGLVYTDPATLI